jgi:hypothetical protein
VHSTPSASATRPIIANAMAADKLINLLILSALSLRKTFATSKTGFQFDASHRPEMTADAGTQAG